MEDKSPVTNTFTFIRIKPDLLVSKKVYMKKKKQVKPKKIKFIPYKTLFNKAVKVFQIYIRNRDKVCVIGRDIEQEKKRCYGYLTCGHLISRGKRILIFSQRNSNGQCQAHNNLHRNYPEVYTNWWINHYGQKAYEALVDASKVNSYKWPREDLEGVIKKYSL